MCKKHSLLQYRTAGALGLKSFPGCCKCADSGKTHAHTHTTPAVAKATYITISFIRMGTGNSEAVLSANSSQFCRKRETVKESRKKCKQLALDHYGDRCCFCTL